MSAYPTVSSEARDRLELLVDGHGLANVLRALAEVCYLKADHIAANWQPTAHDARLWTAAGRYVDSAATMLPVAGVSK